MADAHGEHYRDDYDHRNLRLQKEEVRIGKDCHQHCPNHIPAFAPNAIRESTEGWHSHKTDNGCNNKAGVQQVEGHLQSIHAVRDYKGGADGEGRLVTRANPGGKDNLAPVVPYYSPQRITDESPLLAHP